MEIYAIELHKII